MHCGRIADALRCECVVDALWMRCGSAVEAMWKRCGCLPSHLIRSLSVHRVRICGCTVVFLSLVQSSETSGLYTTGGSFVFLSTCTETTEA